ncbi:MAG: sialidase family protein [Desulfovibrionaceae bacterium]|nr:sialidase family protein [Desulfovibrionaceae bacterium]
MSTPPCRVFPRLALLCLASVLALALLAPFPAAARNPDVSSWMVNLSSGSAMEDNANTHRSPEIAVVGDTVHAVWVTESSDIWQIWYRRSLDGGSTWQERVKIAEGGPNDIDIDETHKRLAVSGTTVHIAFTGTNWSSPWAGTLSYSRSTNNGASFEATQILSQTTGCTLTNSYIVSEGINVSIALRLRSGSGYKRDSGELFTSANDGASFTHTQIFEYAHNDPPYAGATVYDILRSGSNVYVMYNTYNGRGCSYEGESRMFLASSTNSGASFGQSLLSIPQSDGCYKASSGQASHYVSKIAAVDSTVAATWTGTNTDGIRTVFYRRSTNNGADFQSPIELYVQSGGTEISPGQETIKAKGSMTYAMWTTTGALIPFRASLDGGVSFQPAVEASPNGWWPLIDIDPTVPDGSQAHLFWQGNLRTATNGGAALGGKAYLFPFFRFSALRREQVASGADGSLHYVMGGLFHSQSLCGGNCREDIFYRRHSFTPPAPSQSTNLRVISDRSVPFEERFDNMHVPTTADVAPAGAFTLELWVKPAQGGADTGYTNVYRPVAFKPYGNGYSYALGTIIAHQGGSPASDRIITAEITTANGTYRINDQYADTGYVPYGQWAHLAMTYNPAAGANNFRLYLNGVLIDSTSASGAVLSDGNPFEAGHYGNWDLDDLRIWNRALTQAEIVASKNTRQTAASGLVANYTFNNTAKDITNRGNNGILMFKEQYVPDSRPTVSTAGQTVLLLGD